MEITEVWFKMYTHKFLSCHNNRTQTETTFVSKQSCGCVHRQISTSPSQPERQPINGIIKKSIKPSGLHSLPLCSLQVDKSTQRHTSQPIRPSEWYIWGIGHSSNNQLIRLQIISNHPDLQPPCKKVNKSIVAKQTSQRMPSPNCQSSRASTSKVTAAQMCAKCHYGGGGNARNALKK